VRDLILDLRDELEKRDKLLEFIAKVCVNDYDEKYAQNVDKFITQFEELKK